MDRRMLLLGGAFLVGGGLIYWYLKQQGWRCSDFHSEQECLAHNCYWYNGGCHSTPSGEEACWGGTKVCYYDGSTVCDPYNNLCKCIDWKYKLFQSDSPKCHSGLSHNECFPSDMGTATCVPIPGEGADLCPRIGYSEECSCFVAACDPYYFCDTRIYECILKAQNVSISADDTTWEQCFDTVELPWCEGFDVSGRTCDYDIGGRYAASQLLGTFSWEWSMIGDFRLRIYGYLEEIGWTLLDEKVIYTGGTEGSTEIISHFATQGMSKLRFSCCDTLWTNTKPKSFYGHLSF